MKLLKGLVGLITLLLIALLVGALAGVLMVGYRLVTSLAL